MSAMVDAWRARPVRERAILGALVVIVAIVLYIAIAAALERSRRAMATRVAALTAQAATLETHAAEIESLRSAPRPAAPGRDVRSTVELEARSSGVARTLQRIQARGADEVEVVVAATPFAEWLAWVASLERQQIRVRTCRIEALSVPGLVNATATFVRDAER